MVSVHPRVCGERPAGSDANVDCNGSSPRLRGTRPAVGIGRGRGRFIPAFAGNADLLLVRQRGCAVHPRVCGEREYARDGDRLWNGSSPRLRGTLLALVKYDLAARFIPAFAGNACFRSRSGSLCPVHPRVCGERPSMAVSWPARIGSSPRLRGTPSVAAMSGVVLRFIPAFAGNARGGRGRRC